MTRKYSSFGASRIRTVGWIRRSSPQSATCNSAHNYSVTQRPLFGRSGCQGTVGFYGWHADRPGCRACFGAYSGRRGAGPGGRQFRGHGGQAHARWVAGCRYPLAVAGSSWPDCVRSHEGHGIARAAGGLVMDLAATCGRPGAAALPPRREVEYPCHQLFSGFLAYETPAYSDWFTASWAPARARASTTAGSTAKHPSSASAAPEMCTSGTPSALRARTLVPSSGTPRCPASAMRNRRASWRSPGGGPGDGDACRAGGAGAGRPRLRG